MEPVDSTCTGGAKAIDLITRKQLALNAIKKEHTITEAAEKNNVSRKFIHELKNKATHAIDQTFKPQSKKSQDVLFHLPVTKAWLCQFILCLLLHCRANFRGIIKVLDDAFDYPLSIGKIHNIIREEKQKAKRINAQQDLSSVTLGANDEMFHYNKPILTGVDIPSLYCYLLSQEQERDQETWAIHLWDLEQQGYHPERIFADDGSGLRAGHSLALPHIPCDADHFHIIQKMADLRRFFQNRLKSAISYQKKIEDKIKKAALKGTPQKEHADILPLAQQDTARMRYLSESINTLVSWMQHDVLNKAGVDPETRHELYDFILDEFKKLALLHPHRIQAVCIALENQKNLLLAFSTVLNEKFKILSEQFSCNLDILWKICELQRCQKGSDKDAIRSVPLILTLGERFDEIEEAVIHAMNHTERTSSMIENLHSRLRPYFFLRREIGYDYLELLRFYLNHTPFLRSETHRAKKTPAELLMGKPHPHWLEMLGFKRFKRAA